MSELAKKTREAMKRRAERMANGAGPGDDPSKMIDASGWAEPTDMNANAKTGMRPVSRRQFKSGGKVEGEKAACRADRKPRKSGGRVAEYVNRDVRSSNSELGKPHIGGYAAGGATNFRKQMHSDVAEDSRLIKHMVKKDALRVAKRHGGGQFAKRAHKDTDYTAGMRPKGDRTPRKHGGKTKGKTNIVIAINPGAGQQQAQAPAMPVRPPSVPVPVPQAAPQGQGQGMPPQMAGGAPPLGAPPQGMPMQRKDGGKVVGAKYADASIAKAKGTKSVKQLPAGAGGLGRLAKTALTERDYVKA